MWWARTGHQHVLQSLPKINIPPAVLRCGSLPNPEKGGGARAACESLRRTSSIRNPFQITENSGYGEGVVSFTCVPGGAWGAAGNGGVPVLRGLGGGSGTVLCFRSLVGFRAQPA